MINSWSILPYKTYLVNGNDALDFLQGQLTQDVHLINQKSNQYAAYCNPKGRLLAVFLLFYSKNDLYVSLDLDIADKTINHLKKYLFRSKVSISEAAITTFGMTQPIAEQFCQQYNVSLPNTAFASTQNEHFTLNHLAQTNCYELFVTADFAKDVENYLHSIEQETPEKYRLIQLLNNEVHLFEDTVETILPQNTALDKIGAINYKKGCYVGQEIIARNKHLGQIKKAMAFAQLNSNTEIHRGDPIQLQGRDISKVFNHVIYNNQTWVGAIIPFSHLESSVQLNGQDLTFYPASHFANIIS